MSQHAVELCSLLVDEIYGELTSRIFTILQRRGRLTIRLLQEHTQLNQRQLRHGLAVLIQQNLLYYFYDRDTKDTFYDANQDVAYWLVRSGKLTEIAEGTYGSVGLEIVRDLHLLGQAKVSYLVDECDSEEPQLNGKTNGDHVNGLNGGSNGHNTGGQRERILARLFESGMVERVRKSMFRSPTDTRNEIEKELLKEKFGGSTKGTKQKEELSQNVRSRLQSLRADEMDWKPKGRKRALLGESTGTNGNAKRRKLSQAENGVNGNYSSEYEAVGLDGDYLLRINYEKFTITLRNDRLVELACEKIGETTSQVYAAILRIIEQGLARCQLNPRIDEITDLPDGPSITTTELLAALGDTVSIANGIGKAKSDIPNNRPSQTDASKKRKSVEVDDDEDEPGERDHDMNGNGNLPEAAGDPESDDPFAEEPVAKAVKRPKVTFEDRNVDRETRFELLEKHLTLLETDECRFLRRCGAHEWTVDFESLVEHLKESEVNFIIMENFGSLGHRLVRMMRKLGKVDEKTLPHTALTAQKEIRTKLAEMQMAGVVEVQCIPRDAAHTVNRSIYLWFFDADRVLVILLNNLYKTMTRCLQRLEIERRRASGILSLAARSDVMENVNDALTGEQLNLLQNFRDKEEMLLGQVARLDELVGIFRDF